MQIYLQISISTSARICQNYLRKRVFLFPFLDIEHEKEIPSAESISDFIEVARIYTQRGPTFWHCHAGINRSAFMLALYIWMETERTMEESIGLIRSRRDVRCLNNKVFESYLLSLDSK